MEGRIGYDDVITLLDDGSSLDDCVGIPKCYDILCNTINENEKCRTWYSADWGIVRSNYYTRPFAWDY